MGQHKTDTRHHNDHYERNGPKQNIDAIYYGHMASKQALTAPKHQLLFFWFARQASVGGCPVTRNNITRTRKLRQFGSASTTTPPPPPPPPPAAAAAARLVRFWSPDRGSILNASEANRVLALKRNLGAQEHCNFYSALSIRRGLTITSADTPASNLVNAVRNAAYQLAVLT